MAFVITQEILGSECIGDSRIKINSNFDKLDTEVVALSTNTISVSATDTVLHTYTPTIRRLASNVRDNSIQAKHLQTDSVTTAKLSAQAVTSAKLAYDGGPMSGFRNRIINGNFDIWQRGTSFSADGYGADRWYNGRAGTTCTMSREAFTVGQTDVPNEPAYFCRMTVSSVAGASNNARLRHLIENVRILAGQALTVSFYAKADASRPIAVEFSQGFGTGGSPSAPVIEIGAQKVNLTTSWQKFITTISIPSISGKTLGTNNDSFLQLVFWFDAGSDYNSRTDSLGQQSGTFDIAQVQVEQGSVATPFEMRPIGTELALCQRYYYRINGSLIGDVFASGFCQNASTATGAVFFPVSMRTTPTVLEQSGVAAQYRVTSGVGVDCTGIPVFSTATQNVGRVNFTASGFTTGQGALLVASGSAPTFLAWSAEL